MTLFNQFRSTLARPAVLATCLGLVAGSVAIQEFANFAVPTVAHAAGNLADGWSQRADTGAAADNKLTMEGSAIHVVTTGGPMNNAVFTNPAWTSTGNHTFSATFTQNVKATHPDAYGLVIGGSKLADPDQAYTYFVLHQNGDFYIANRKGDKVTPVVPFTKNAAIKAEGADGKQVNTLSIEVKGNDVIFSANGTEVSRQPKSAVMADGLFGFRICHRLDISITDIKK